MDKRQAEVERLTLEYEKQCLNDLQKSYTEALADVKLRLKGLLGREDQTQSVIYQIQLQEQIQQQLETALNRLKSGSITSVTDFLNKTYEDSYLGVIYGLQGQGIPINIGIDHDQLARTVNRKTETLQFSDRLYKNVDELGVAFKSEMSRGIANGSTYSKIAKQLSMQSEASYKQAMRIVRTEGGRVKSEAKLNSMHKAKNEGADIVKQWDSTFDGKTRPEHRLLDGQIREIEEDFEIEYNGKLHKAQAPHKFKVAGLDVNCRCIVVERARWAVEGEEMPNKVHNHTGDLIEAKDYREWKEKAAKQLDERKQKRVDEKLKEIEQRGKKVFDKNTGKVPAKGDYFRTVGNDLIEVVEVNDYNGIKSVTLANGQTVVLKNAKQVLKLNESNFPKAFTDSKRTKTQTQALVDYVNGLEGADERAKQVLAKLGDLESFDGQGIDFKIAYTANDHALSTREYITGRAVDAKFSIPKLEGDDIRGAANTVLHETGHLIDYYAGTKNSRFAAITESNAKFVEAIKEGVGNPSDEIMAVFKQAKADYDEIGKMFDVNAELQRINQIYRDGGFSSYKAYSKAYNSARKDVVLRRDMLRRNRLNGVNNLQDIYDALSGGKWRDSGQVQYGHGVSYFRSGDARAKEIFANYFSLSITRPDLVDMLRRDKPKLVEALDEIMDDILKGG